MQANDPLKLMRSLDMTVPDLLSHFTADMLQACADGANIQAVGLIGAIGHTKAYKVTISVAPITTEEAESLIAQIKAAQEAGDADQPELTDLDLNLMDAQGRG